LVKAPILGIDDINAGTQFTIFPNPASNTINISSNQTPITSIAIKDVLGKLVYSEEFSATDSRTLDISSFAKGMYFVLVNNIVSKKIIKE